MHTKTMEGIVGARTNMDLLNTPFRVYKEARRRGDTATMDRAMGYAAEFSDKADEYKTKADEGMKEDAESAKEKAEAEREKAIQKRREEREKLEDRVSLKGNDAADGDDNVNTDNVNTDSETSASVKTDMEPVIYTKNGEVNRQEKTDGSPVKSPFLKFDARA